MIRHVAAVLSLGIALAGSLTIAGCGDSPDTTILVDCSRSVADSSKSWTNQIASFVAQTWDEGGEVTLECFSGARAHLDEASFFPEQQQVVGSSDAPTSCKLAYAVASKLRAQIQSFIEPKVGVLWTNWTGALSVAANTGNTSRIVMFSDLIQQVPGFDLTKKASESEITTTAAEAAKGLKKLQKMDIYFVGIDADTGNLDAGPRASELLDALIKDASFTPKARLAAAGSLEFSKAKRICGNDGIVSGPVN